jgi:hypothetical protein
MVRISKNMSASKDYLAHILADKATNRLENKKFSAFFIQP